MTALLKEPIDYPSVHTRRITNAQWASVGQDLRRVLKESNAFPSWQADAVAAAMVEVAQRDGRLTAEALEDALHSRQFPKEKARTLSETIARAYG